MAQAQTLESRYETVMRGASIDLLVPQAPITDISALLHDSLPEQISSVASRRNLFLGLDERVDLFSFLKITGSRSDGVESLLPDLDVTISAHATDAVPQGNGNAASASGKHDLVSVTFPATETTHVIVSGDDTCVFWKRSIHIPRPRVRLQRPAVYFTGSVGLTGKAVSEGRQSVKDNLKPFEQVPANVLAPLRFDTSLRDANVYVSEQHITKLAPAAGISRHELKPIRGASKRAFPVVPALFTKVRYSALPNAVMASLHLETSQVVSETVVIRNAVVTVAGAFVEAYNPVEEPIHTLAGDETVLLYRLIPTEDGSARTPSAFVVNIQASTSIDHNSNIDLDITWQAQVDLSQAMVKKSYKWSRPLSGGAVQVPSLPSAQHNSKPATSDGPLGSTTGETGIIFNFTAPRTVATDSDFHIEVQCLNGSDRTRRFALVMLPIRWEAQTQRPLSSGTFTSTLHSIEDQPLERKSPPDVLDLNPDVRIGPLPSGACFETQMAFRAIAKSVVELGALRIVDLDTRQTVDVHELPEIRVS